MTTPAVAACAVAVAFMLGLFAGTARTFDIADKLTTGNLLTAAVSLGIAVALSVIFNRNFSESRAEKELLADQVAETLEWLKETRSAFHIAYHENKPKDHEEKLLSSLRVVSNMLGSLETACQERTVYMSPHLKRAREEFRKYRLYLTERAFNRKTFLSSEYTDSETAFSAIQHELFLFRLFVNKC